MKTSYFCALVISALVVQISSEATELDKTATSLFHSLVDIVGISCRKIDHILSSSGTGEKKEPFLDDFMIKLKRKKEEIEKTYMESLSPETRALHKKSTRVFSAVVDASIKLRDSIQDFSQIARNMTNVYFNKLPKETQNKFIVFGKDLNTILLQLKVMFKNDSTAEKTK